MPKKEQLDVVKLYVLSSSLLPRFFLQIFSMLSAIIRVALYIILHLVVMSNLQYIFNLPLLPDNSNSTDSRLTPALPLTHRPDRITLYTLPSQPLFYQHMDDPLTPHLKLIHQYPDLFTRVRVDRGAIRFVLSGATLMVPGYPAPDLNCRRLSASTRLERRSS